MIKYKEIFKTLRSEQKLEFFEQVLNNSSDIQSQFVNYFTKVADSITENKEDNNKDIAHLIEEYKTELENLDLEEPDYGRWENKSDRYYEHWEIASELIDEEVSELFDEFSAEIVNSISQGEIELAMAQLTGLLIACETVEVDDPYDNLGGDPNLSFLENFEIIVEDIKGEIVKTILNPNMVSNAIIKTIEYLYDQNIEKSHTEKLDELMNYLLHINIDGSKTVYSTFNNNKDLILSFPNTFLASVKTTNPTMWLSEAEKLCSYDVHVASELLAYQSANDIIAFHQEAKKLFAIFPNELIDEITQLVDASIDFNFTIEVYKYNINKSQDIEVYKKLAVLLNKQEKQNFIELFKNEFSARFYIKLLEQEGEFEQILYYAQTYKGYITIYYDIMLPIIHKYPDACFKILQPKISTFLDTNINRTSYTLAANLMKFLASNNENIHKINTFAKELCKLYPRRSALKEEFRMAKFEIL